MLVVRCTAKLLRRIKSPPMPSAARSTNRLGDWYATILPLRPAQLVLLVSEATRLPVVLLAREFATLDGRIPLEIARVLHDLGVEPSIRDAELMAMCEIAFDRTASRSVLGTMNEFTSLLKRIREDHPDMTERDMSLEMGRFLVTIPGHGYQHPGEFTARYLESPPATLALVPPARKETPMSTTPAIYELKVTLRDSRPPIWRRLRVRNDITLAKLHDLVQDVMGWEDCHMHLFVAGGKNYGANNPEFPQWENEQTVSLAQVLRKPKDSLVYEYDFGDGWEHTIVLEQQLEATPGGTYPYVVDGKRACPPEDCGGVGGYRQLLAVLADPKHPQHAEMREWADELFDPDAFNADAFNRQIHGDDWVTPARDAAGRKETEPRQTTLELGTTRRKR